MPREDTQFKPGQSGNPTGRPPDPLLAALRRRMTPSEARELVDVLMAKARAGDTRAIEMIWDRLGGKPIARNEQGEPGAFTRGYEIRLIDVDADGRETRSA